MRLEGLPDVLSIPFVPAGSSDTAPAIAIVAAEASCDGETVTTALVSVARGTGRHDEVAEICGAIAVARGRWFIAIRSDEMITLELLKVLSQDRRSAVVAVRPQHSRSEADEAIRSMRGIVSPGVDLCTPAPAALVFAGAMSFPPHVHKAVLRLADQNSGITWVELIARLGAIHLLRTVSSIRGRSLGGGSFASSKVVSIFRKEARGRGKAKLRDEIAFLSRLPEPLQGMYPKLLRWEELGADGLAMDQEFISWPNLRAHIQSEGTDLYEIIQRLRFLLHELKQHSYYNAVEPAPSNYLDRLHFRRVRDRINMTCELCPSFQGIVAAREVVINGVPFANAGEILNRLEDSRAVRELVTPPLVGPYAHGDLHFENILFDPATLGVKIVDPRGYPLCDIYYDLGKLSHSANGKYDLIHEGRFTLLHTAEANQIRATFNFPDQALVQAYDQINSHLRNWCYELTNEDEWAVARMLFNEAIHFCADMPFHLKGDGEEAKSIAIYLTGVRLLNEFVADWN